MIANEAESKETAAAMSRDVVVLQGDTTVRRRDARVNHR